MYQEGTDHLIWSNYDLDLEDWRESLEELYPHYSEDELYEKMYDSNAANLDDERCNLNIQLSSPILVIGDLGLWYGRRTGYKESKAAISVIVCIRIQTIPLGMLTSAVSSVATPCTTTVQIITDTVPIGTV